MLAADQWVTRWGSGMPHPHFTSQTAGLFLPPTGVQTMWPALRCISIRSITGVITQPDLYLQLPMLVTVKAKNLELLTLFMMTVRAKS